MPTMQRAAKRSARAPRAAGHAHRDQAQDLGGADGIRAASQRRTLPAAVLDTRTSLSRCLARGNARGRAALQIFAGGAALRISGGDRAAGRDANLVSAPVDRGWL